MDKLRKMIDTDYGYKLDRMSPIGWIDGTNLDRAVVDCKAPPRPEATRDWIMEALDHTPSDECEHAECTSDIRLPSMCYQCGQVVDTPLTPVLVVRSKTPKVALRAE
jgi:hypothetical protein